MAEYVTGTHHKCKMPRRRGRWRHRVYVCDCGAGWVAKYYASQGSMSECPPGGYYLWHLVHGLQMSSEPEYNHG